MNSPKGKKPSAHLWIRALAEVGPHRADCAAHGFRDARCYGMLVHASHGEHTPLERRGFMSTWQLEPKCYAR